MNSGRIIAPTTRSYLPNKRKAYQQPPPHLIRIKPTPPEVIPIKVEITLLHDIPHAIGNRLRVSPSPSVGVVSCPPLYRHQKREKDNDAIKQGLY